MPIQHILLALLLTASLHAEAATHRVLAIGDSITEGFTYLNGNGGWIPGGYRAQLASDLAAAGYAFAHTGIFTSNTSSSLTSSGNTRHCGCTSWRIDQLNASLVGDADPSTKTIGCSWARSDTGNWLSRLATAGISPDIVLFMAGTNDISAGASQAILRTRIETTLNAFLVNLPDAYVLIGTVIARKESLSSTENLATQAFNNALATTIIPAWKTAHPGHKVFLVDQYTYFANHPDGLYDLLHPNQTGYNAMGTTWANAIAAHVPLGVATYTVTYNGNGSTGGSPPNDGHAYASGATVTVLGNTGSLVKAGSTFAGWNTAANGSGTAYAGGATFAIGAANRTLYAQWTAIPTYTVTGRVTVAGNGIAGVTLTDGTRSAVTDASGTYRLSGVPAGTYTVTPVLTGYVFAPASATITVSGPTTVDAVFIGTSATGTSTGSSDGPMHGTADGRCGAGGMAGLLLIAPALIGLRAAWPSRRRPG